VFEILHVKGLTSYTSTVSIPKSRMVFIMEHPASKDGVCCGVSCMQGWCLLWSIPHARMVFVVEQAEGTRVS
jgi:hypothetical protein